MSIAPLYYQANCVLSDPSGGAVTGSVFFKEHRVNKNSVTVTGRVAGLTAGKHGFHIHADKAITESCTGAGGHYNPDENDHAGPRDGVRHAGDLGNIVADREGVANINYEYNGLSLDSITNNIVGRAIVVHAGEDDLGLGGAADSLTTGAAGGRVACCVITELAADALPDGANCNSSKAVPAERRPVCAAGLCCGAAGAAAATDVVEVCRATGTATTPIPKNSGTGGEIVMED